MQQQSPARIVGTVSVVSIDAIEANGWNPNVQSEWMFDKERESIRKHGFVDPVTVRSGREKGPLFKKLQIIDGEHRLKAGKLELMTHIPINDVGRMSDAQAKVLGDVLNNLKGTNDPIRWQQMIETVKIEEPGLLKFLPYSDKEIEARLRSSEVNWGDLERRNEEPHANQRQDTEGRLFKKFSVSVPEKLMGEASDLMRRIKAAYKIDDDAAAFKVVIELAEQGLGARRTSVPPSAPAPQPEAAPAGRRRRRAA